jgi:periplasmic divalent cation tolerance protein
VVTGESGDGAVEVHVTTPDGATAERIARALVREHLAACVQVVPAVRSYYRWEGRVEEDDEHLLLVKSQARLFAPIRDLVRSEHPYDTPEVLAVPVFEVDDRYFSWLKESVRREARDGTAPLTEDPP